jgi:hypothetical protein
MPLVVVKFLQLLRFTNTDELLPGLYPDGILTVILLRFKPVGGLVIGLLITTSSPDAGIVADAVPVGLSEVFQ